MDPVFWVQLLNVGCTSKEKEYAIVTDGERVGTPIKSIGDAEKIADWLNRSVAELRLKFERKTK